MQAEKLSLDAAFKLSQNSYKELIPNGLQTDGHYFYSIMLKGHRNVVVCRIKGQAFVYDFLIDENFRGKGYGKASLAWLETEVLKFGFKSIKLHVFEHNHYARALYEKVGYFTTERTMIKSLNVPAEKNHRE